MLTDPSASLENSFLDNYFGIFINNPLWDEELELKSKMYANPTLVYHFLSLSTPSYTSLTLPRLGLQPHLITTYDTIAYSQKNKHLDHRVQVCP